MWCRKKINKEIKTKRYCLREKIIIDLKVNIAKQDTHEKVTTLHHRNKPKISLDIDSSS
jgi:hypothetical protein